MIGLPSEYRPFGFLERWAAGPSFAAFSISVHHMVVFNFSTATLLFAAASSGGDMSSGGARRCMHMNIHLLIAIGYKSFHIPTFV